MRYVAASIWAVIVFVATIILLGLGIGMAFDGITGPWVIVPLFGQLAVATGAAALAFRSAIRSG